MRNQEQTTILRSPANGVISVYKDYGNLLTMLQITWNIFASAKQNDILIKYAMKLFCEID